MKRAAWFRQRPEIIKAEVTATQQPQPLQIEIPPEVSGPELPIPINTSYTAKLMMVKDDERVVYYWIVDIIKAVCLACDIDRVDLVSDRREVKFVRARHTIVTLAKIFTDLSLPAIGRTIKRDHTTILHAIRKMKPVLRELSGTLSRSEPLEVWVASALIAYDNNFPCALYGASKISNQRAMLAQT